MTPMDDLHDMPPFSNFHTPSSQQLEPSDPTNTYKERDNLSSYHTSEYQVDQE
jgi:hypothetical protein